MRAKHGNAGGAMESHQRGGNGGEHCAESSSEFDTVTGRIHRAGLKAFGGLNGLVLPMRIFCPLFCASSLLISALLAGKQNIGVLQQVPPPGAPSAVNYRQCYNTLQHRL